MDRDITRRDFVHDVSLAALGAGFSGLGMASPGLAGDSGSLNGDYYPPTRTGMRGSHPGSFEVAHALAREGVQFDNPPLLGEEYDLVVVGGGISGLASAWYYRERYGADSRILIIENHDDFGGHAKRNEFHQGGSMRLAWGGVFNLEFPMFSDTVRELLADLGVSIDRLLENFTFNPGGGGKLGPAIWFDEQTYGRDVLIPRFSLRHGLKYVDLEEIDRFPLDEASRESLKRFFTMRTDVLAHLSVTERLAYLESTSYIDFLKEHGGLSDDAAELFVKTTDGYWGVGAHSLSVMECRESGLPVRHLLGEAENGFESDFARSVAMFPDGNASIARLLVRDLIPGIADGSTMDDIVTAKFDYAMLDRPESAVRLRLNSTAVRAVNEGDRVRVNYVRDGENLGVSARHCVLACWHRMIPHLCPELPLVQREAMAYQVKRPLVLTNVLIRNGEAVDRIGMTGAYCPGRLHEGVWVVKGISVGDYQNDYETGGPVVMMFFGAVAPPDRSVNAREQHRASHALLMGMNFEDFEREVRTVLDGMLGPGGFDAAEDILAITVNRWPHGYAYDYLDLWDPDWPEGQAPHEIARRPFGNITMANADAGADAYTHIAIDQAYRAVNELG